MTVEQVVAVIHQNSANAGKVVRAAVKALPGAGEKSPFADALKYAVMTDKGMIPAATKEKLGLLIGKYM